MLWVCNNGGMEWFDRGGKLFPIGCARDYEGGSIQRVDLETGAVETVWRNCGGEPLKGPNDLVFDRDGRPLVHRQRQGARAALET